MTPVSTTVAGKWLGDDEGRTNVPGGSVAIAAPKTTTAPTAPNANLEFSNIV
jgi:hypothetical protein